MDLKNIFTWSHTDHKSNTEPRRPLIISTNSLSYYCVTISHVADSAGSPTNASVEDEPVQPILRMNILPARRDFFFHLLFAGPLP
jgi:hypothetical protein